jgi:DNA helicase-2/ATP-dependent DNA helicase PcrA
VKVATFIDHHPMVSALLARRYPVVVCDEHQDCSGGQHAIAMALHRQGARLRVFADPMQRIYKDNSLPGGQPPPDWASLARSAGAFEELDTPHRWHDGCAELGAWTLGARRILKAGGRIDLRGKLPRGVEVVLADNQARRYGDYQLAAADRRAIDDFERAHDSLLIVSHFAKTAQNLRAFFGRRLPLWEGHTRPALVGLIEATRAQQGKTEGAGTGVGPFNGRDLYGIQPVRLRRPPRSRSCGTLRPASEREAGGDSGDGSFHRRRARSSRRSSGAAEPSRIASHTCQLL